MVNKTKLHKYKLVLINEDIFCFKADGESNDFVKIINLRFTFVDKCKEVKITDTIFYPANLLTNFNYPSETVDIFFDTPGELDNFSNCVRGIKNNFKIKEKYEILTQIGNGRFGTVFTGINKSRNIRN